MPYTGMYAVESEYDQETFNEYFSIMITLSQILWIFYLLGVAIQR